MLILFVIRFELKWKAYFPTIYFIFMVRCDILWDFLSGRFLTDRFFGGGFFSSGVI